jgi:hypothetical protein
MPLNWHLTMTKCGILAAIFLSKYAENEDLGADTSLGKPINAIKTRQLKDKLILIYDKLTKDVTALPAFQDINAKLSDNPHWIEVNRLMINFVNYINDRNLKDGFNYSVKLLDKLNELRNDLIRSKIPHDEVIELDNAIRSLQLTMWEETKRFLNIHNLRGVTLDFPELSGILEGIKPGWDFSGPKNPVKKPIRQRWQTVSDLMKRLERENQEEQNRDNQKRSR